jgi:hypothetical protein
MDILETRGARRTSSESLSLAIPLIGNPGHGQDDGFLQSNKYVAINDSDRELLGGFDREPRLEITYSIKTASSDIH